MVIVIKGRLHPGLLSDAPGCPMRSCLSHSPLWAPSSACGACSHDPNPGPWTSADTDSRGGWISRNYTEGYRGKTGAGDSPLYRNWQHCVLGHICFWEVAKPSIWRNFRHKFQGLPLRKAKSGCCISMGTGIVLLVELLFLSLSRAICRQCDHFQCAWGSFWKSKTAAKRSAWSIPMLGQKFHLP